MTFGVVPTGFNRKDLAQIITDLEAGWLGIFGSDTDISPGTPDAQIIGLFAAAIDEAWQAAEDSYSSFRPRQAEAVGLSDIVGLNGISRIDGNPSVVIITIGTSGPDVTLDELFRLESDEKVLFQAQAPGLYSDLDDVLFEAVVDGPTPITVGNITKIVTAVPNLTSVVNPGDALDVVGWDVETDQALRTRQLISTEGQAQFILEVMTAQLFQVPGVTRVRIYVNETNGIVDGRPGHSYEVVVVGGADDVVAQVIMDLHPAGITLVGTTTVFVLTLGEQTIFIDFSRPATVLIDVEVTLSAGTLYPPTGDADIQQAIVDYANGVLPGFEGGGYGIGDDVARTRLYDAINSVPGHSVTLLEISANPAAVGEPDVSIDEVEIADFQIANITVTS